MVFAATLEAEAVIEAAAPAGTAGAWVATRLAMVAARLRLMGSGSGDTQGSRSSTSEVQFDAAAVALEVGSLSSSKSSGCNHCGVVSSNNTGGGSE